MIQLFLFWYFSFFARCSIVSFLLHISLNFKVNSYQLHNLFRLLFNLVYMFDCITSMHISLNIRSIILNHVVYTWNIIPGNVRIWNACTGSKLWCQQTVIRIEMIPQMIHEQKIWVCFCFRYIKLWFENIKCTYLFLRDDRKEHSTWKKKRNKHTFNKTITDFINKNL